MTARTSAAAAVVVVLLGAGCGEGRDGRQAVADYVTTVNRVELDLREPLLELQRSNARFSTKRPEQAHSEAVRARTTILRLQHDLQQVDPPREAERLHARLLALVDAELALARETELLSEFLPRLERALAPMATIQRRLNAALRASRGRAAQATALEAYADRLDERLRALRALHPPPVSMPVRDGQVATLGRVRATALKLAEALRSHADERLPELERRFTIAAQSYETVGAQRARIAAIAAYNRRVKALGTLASRVQRERIRLDRTL